MTITQTSRIHALDGTITISTIVQEGKSARVGGLSCLGGELHVHLGANRSHFGAFQTLKMNHLLVILGSGWALLR